MMEIADTEMGACKECPSDIQSPEGISKTTGNEIDREGVKKGVQSLVDEDTQEELSHEAANDRGAFEANGSHQDDDVNLIFLREKLSAALQKVSIKDELVKQHSKVAEEAVLGWEKAEKETAALKQQLNAAVESKSALESRVSHLDEALKECVRQLRLGREEQEMSITQAVAERTVNLEAAKTKLEDRLVELQRMVETCSASSTDLELQDKIESLERENIYLKQHLQTLCEELEVRSIERDLSTKAAETASKQHLESINKVARLEAECRKLKSLSRMSSSNNRAASSYVDSLTDGQSGSWASSVLVPELDQSKSEKVVDKSLHSSKEINLMDDFLEMERLAGLPDTRPRVLDDCNQPFEKPFSGKENELKAELNSLEENLRRVEGDKAELELALAQTQSCLDNSEVQLREAQIKLDQLEGDLQGVIEGEQFYKAKADSLEEEAKLMSSQLMSLRGEMTRERALSEEKESRIEQLEGELKEKEEEVKLKDVALAETRVWLEMSEAQLRETETKVKERALSEEKASRIEQLEGELKEKGEEMKLKDEALAETRVWLEVLEAQLKETEAKVKERALSEEKASRIEQLEGELKEKEDEVKLKDVALSETRVLLEMSEAQLRETEAKVKELEKDLHKAIEEKESLNSELDNVRAQIDSTSEAQMRETEAKVKELEKDLHKAIEEKESLNSELDNVLAQVDSTSTQIDSLTRQVREKQCLEVQFSTKVKEVERLSLENESLNRKVQKEEALVAELSTQVKELERELQQKRVELEAQQRAQSDPERKIKQEELAAAAAGKLADCQKTIASLGSQLNSLAALEDFLIDTACIPPAPLMADRRNSDDPWKLHSNDTFLAEKRLEAFASHGRGDPQASSVSSSFFLNHSDHDKIENGFAKYFSVSRN
ncbi:uncharacterized protein LOC141586373 [Silene latifolia]|uniref:uncharacterized protein LOC141586373 n=1 Tax=Silene latifolia TaxID=37657 RepID=UPI003D786D84